MGVADNLGIALGDFLVPLRQHRGLDEEKFEALCSILKACREEWKDVDAIPKRTVKALVDIYPATIAHASWYEREKQEYKKIKKAALKLLSLTSKALS
ncbi:MAG TPA: hypothetical protein VJ464_22460 [Blastocatellia bacterium]|nr:hypothetical protein [Blastocatellia bacterium]